MDGGAAALGGAGSGELDESGEGDIASGPSADHSPLDLTSAARSLRIVSASFASSLSS
jgi:hypothetical protein